MIMNRSIVALVGMLFAVHSQAADLSFDSVLYSTFAQADAGAQTDSQSATSPPLPIYSSAFAQDGAANHASAFGQAGTRLLAVDALAASDSQAADAFGAATFLGSFSVGAGRFNLHIHFDSADQQAGSPGSLSSEGKIAVSLFGNSDALYEQSFAAATTIDQAFEFTTDTVGSLEIILTSTATAQGAFARNASSAQFETSFAPVPEPATWVLSLVGLLLLPLVIRRRSGHAPSPC